MRLEKMLKKLRRAWVETTLALATCELVVGKDIDPATIFPDYPALKRQQQDLYSLIQELSRG